MGSGHDDEYQDDSDDNDDDDDDEHKGAGRGRGHGYTSMFSSLFGSTTSSKQQRHVDRGGRCGLGMAAPLLRRQFSALDMSQVLVSQPVWHNEARHGMVWHGA